MILIYHYRDMDVRSVSQASVLNASASGQAASTASGQFHGAAVQANSSSSLQSKIQDAQEELPMHHSEHKSAETKAKDRKKTSTAGRQIELLQMLEEVNKTLNAEKPNEQADQMLAFLRQLRKQRNSDSGDILRQTKERFENPAHQHTALVFAERALKEELGEDATLSQAVRGAKDLLLEKREDAAKVCANYNVLTEATAKAEAALKGTAAEKILHFYSAIVFEKDSTSQTHNALMKAIGSPSKYMEAHEAFIKEVGSHLESTGPLITKEELRNMTDSIYNMKFLSNFMKSGEELFKHMDAVFKIYNN